MAAGLVFYTVNDQDVKTLAQIGAGRRVRALPVKAGEEYAAMVTRSPVPEAPADANRADLLVFVNGSQPYLVRNVAVGTGEPGTFATEAQAASVG